MRDRDKTIIIRRKNFLPAVSFALILTLVIILIGLTRRLSAYYESGNNAAVLATAGGGVASASPYWSLLNPSLVSFVPGGTSAAVGYRRFFVGMNIPSYLKEIPGYIAPEIDEKNLEIFYGFPGDFSAGFGYYAMDLARGFSSKTLALYAAWRLDDILPFADGEEREGLSVGIALKNVGIFYYPDEYTSDFFSKYASEKYALTYDCGVFYSYGRFNFAFAGNNLLPSASLGIYDRDSGRLPAGFVVGGAVDIADNFKFCMDGRLSSESGFEEVAPSFIWDVASAVSLMAGVNSSQVSSGISIRVRDFDFTAAFIYPWVISDGFGDVAVLIGWRFNTISDKERFSRDNQ